MTEDVLALLAEAVAAIADRVPLGEPPEAAAAVEAWRRAWLPAAAVGVRVLLLAESHMAMTREELACPVAIPPGLDWPAPAPAPFVRHLYCPAYGEPSLAPGFPAGRASAGTPQYWRLMAAAEDAAMPALPRLRRAPGVPAAARLAAKAALLRRLRDRGVWLTDASVVAVAAPGGGRAAAAAHAAALRESWARYHARLLPALAPARVVVIGRAVAAVLRRELDAAFPGRWEAVAQPMGARGREAAAAMLGAVAGACARWAPAPRRGAGAARVSAGRR